MKTGTYQDRIFSEWTNINNEMLESKAFQRLNKESLSPEHYKSVLRQTYLQTRDNPQVQAAVTMKLTGKSRSIIRKMMGHALSEVGHDQLALNDLRVLGEDTDAVTRMRPLPGTAALMGFSYHAAMHMNPAVYFGYLYYLESMPIKSGQAHMDRLRSLGVPEEAMTFIDEHAKFDVAHMKLNQEYIDTLVQSEEDFQDFVFGMRTTATLYSRMIEDAFAAADKLKSHFELNLKESLSA